MIDMTYEQAIALLKNAVKFSAVKNQKHLSFQLVNSEDLELYKDALMLVRSSVDKGERTQAELNTDLGLI